MKQILKQERSTATTSASFLVDTACSERLVRRSSRLVSSYGCFDDASRIAEVFLPRLREDARVSNNSRCKRRESPAHQPSHANRPSHGFPRKGLVVSTQHRTQDSDLPCSRPDASGQPGHPRPAASIQLEPPRVQSIRTFTATSPRSGWSQTTSTWSSFGPCLRFT